jgi:hypothetical protein
LIIIYPNSQYLYVRTFFIIVLPYTGETPNLKCHTSRYQLTQTRRWLDEMMKSEIFNDSEDFDRHLHGFCNSLASTIDYVHADFVYHKVKKINEYGNLGSIDWKRFSRSRRDQEEIIDNHPEKDALKKFRSEYKNKKNILLKDPLVNYFYNKRQESSHIQWSGSKFGSFSGETGNEHWNHRALEGQFWFELHAAHPTDSLPQFDDYIPIEQQLDAMRILTDDSLDISDIGNQVCDKIEEFIGYFDGKDYFT